MTRSFAAIAGAGLIAAAALAPAPAEAQYYHRHGYNGGALAAGAVLGLAAGAIIGSSAARAAPPAYYYGPPPGAYAEPVCYLANRRVWVDGMGWTVRRVQICE